MTDDLVHVRLDHSTAVWCGASSPVFVDGERYGEATCARCIQALCEAAYYGIAAKPCRKPLDHHSRWVWAQNTRAGWTTLREAIAARVYGLPECDCGDPSCPSRIPIYHG